MLYIKNTENSSKYKHALLTVEEAIKDRINFNDPIKDLNVNSIPLAIKNKLVDGNSAEEKENLCKNLLNNPIDKETIAKALVSIDYFNYRDKKMPDVSDIRNSTDEELVEDYNEKLIKLGEMHNQGLLSDEEFISLKQELLSSNNEKCVSMSENHIETSEKDIETSENNCENCGACIFPDDIFCSECGTKINNNQEE